MLRVAMLGDFPIDPNRLIGGVQAVVRYLSEALAANADLDLHIVTLQANALAPVMRLRPNLTVHYVRPTYRLANITFFFVNKLRLLQKLSQLEPDLIHAQVAGTFAEVMQIAGRPGVLTAHGIRYLEPSPNANWLMRHIRLPLIRRQELNTIRAARHLIAISPYIVWAFGTAIHGQVYQIENPIPEHFFLPVQNSEPGRILFVGTLEERKSVHQVIEALGALRHAWPQARLRLAGSARLPTYEAYLRALTKQQHLEEQVDFLGRLHDDQLVEEYARCSVVILPSRQETAPMVIQQAMAAGKPVIATRVGGIPYLVEHGNTGWLVPYGNHVALTEALQYALEDPAQATSMGLRAQAQARERFQSQLVAQQTLAVYERLAQGE